MSPLDALGILAAVIGGVFIVLALGSAAHVVYTLWLWRPLSSKELAQLEPRWPLYADRQRGPFFEEYR